MLSEAKLKDIECENSDVARMSKDLRCQRLTFLFTLCTIS